MNSELEQRLLSLYELLEEQKQELEDAAMLCVEAINGMNKRVERLEKWMTKKEYRSLNKIKALT